MKKVLAAAALLALAACAKAEVKEEMPAMDSMAPADTTMPRDTAQKM